MRRPADPLPLLAPIATSVPGIAAPALPSALGQNLMTLLFQYERTQWWAATALRERQLAQLRGVLAHARAQVPFYRGHAARAALDPATFTLADFARWPLLRNEDLLAHEAALTARALPPEHGGTSWNATTGSSGKPRRILQTEAYGLHQMALVLRNYLWHAVDAGEKMMSIRAGERAGRFDQWSRGTAAVFRTGPIVQFATAEPVPALCEHLFAEAPGYLQGPSTLLKEIILEAGARRPPGLRALIGYNENMPADLPALARERWGVPVIDTYSCAEMGILALQCPEHGRLHVMEEAVHLEILREDGSPCEVGERGRAVITTLNNFAMPLIRYELGDIIERGAPCPCGRGLQALGPLVGRVRHLLTDPQGRRYWPAIPSATELLRIAPIRQLQYRQAAPDHVEVLYHMDRDLSAAQAAALCALIAAELDFPFRYTPVRSNGDLRALTGKLEPAAIRRDT